MAGEDITKKCLLHVNAERGKSESTKVAEARTAVASPFDTEGTLRMRPDQTKACLCVELTNVFEGILCVTAETFHTCDHSQQAVSHHMYGQLKPRQQRRRTDTSRHNQTESDRNVATR